MIRRPTRYTRTATLCPYWTLVRSAQQSRDIIPNTCIGIAIRIVDRYPVTIGKSDGGEPAIQPFHLARGQFAAGVGPDVRHIVGAADDRLMDRVHAAVFRAGLTCAKGKGEGSQQRQGSARSEAHTSELQS